MSKKVIRYLLIGIALFMFVNIPKVSAGKECMPSCPNMYSECMVIKDECEQKIALGYGKSSTTIRTNEDEDNFSCSNANIYRAIDIVSKTLYIIRIIVPVIIVITGMVSYSKAVISQDENDIKEMFGLLIKKLAIGAAIFFVPLIIITIMKYAVGSYEEPSSPRRSPWADCIDLLK